MGKKTINARGGSSRVGRGGRGRGGAREDARRNLDDSRPDSAVDVPDELVGSLARSMHRLQIHPDVYL